MTKQYIATVSWGFVDLYILTKEVWLSGHIYAFLSLLPLLTYDKENVQYISCRPSVHRCGIS